MQCTQFEDSSSSLRIGSSSSSPAAQHCLRLALCGTTTRRLSHPAQLQLATFKLL